MFHCAYINDLVVYDVVFDFFVFALWVFWMVFLFMLYRLHWSLKNEELMSGSRSIEKLSNQVKKNTRN